ncbi:hypothetical protein WDU94_007975 [Cyamophila willieti]
MVIKYSICKSYKSEDDPDNVIIHNSSFQGNTSPKILQNEIHPSVTVLPNGYLADTPEVAAAKATFFAQQARADSSFTPSAVIPSNSNNRYASSFAPASITVLPNGYLADTPEVAAAKSAHLAEVARASVPNPYYNEYYTWTGTAWVPKQ